MRKFFSLLSPAVALALVNCSGTREIPSGSLTRTSLVVAEAIPNRQARSDAMDKTQIESLREANQKAKSPTFGLIKAFYQLPKASPAGAVILEEAYGPLSAYRKLTLTQV